MPYKSFSFSLLAIGLFILVIISPLAMQGQRFAFKPQVHQLELQMGSVNSVTALTSLYKSELPFSTDIVNGGRYTYHYSLTHGFRVGAFLRTANLVTPPLPGSLENYEPKKRDLDITLGYIYKHHINAAQLYAGVDLRYSIGNLEETRATNDVNGYNYQTYGLGGLVGLRYFLSQNMSMGFEANVNYASFSAPSISNNEPGQFYRLPDNMLDIGASVNVSFHLVKMKKRCTCPRFK